mgnify:CR=1 FL=1
MKHKKVEVTTPSQQRKVANDARKVILKWVESQAADQVYKNKKSD